MSNHSSLTIQPFLRVTENTQGGSQDMLRIILTSKGNHGLSWAISPPSADSTQYIRARQIVII